MAWDKIWEDVFSQQEWGRYPGEDLIRFVAKNFYSAENRRSVKLLEVGCGPGGNLWYMAREGFSVYGIDGSRTAITSAKSRLDKEIPGWKGEVICGDMTILPYENETFHGVIDNEAIYCNSFDASVEIYGEIGRVLVPEGKLFSRTFTAGSMGDGTGQQIGPNCWLVSEGPATGKGPCRFTHRSEIPVLLQGFALDTVDLISRTVAGNPKNLVSEWLITAHKKLAD